MRKTACLVRICLSRTNDSVKGMRTWKTMSALNRRNFRKNEPEGRLSVRMLADTINIQKDTARKILHTVIFVRQFLTEISAQRNTFWRSGCSKEENVECLVTADSNLSTLRLRPVENKLALVRNCEWGVLKHSICFINSIVSVLLFNRQT